VSRRGRSPAAWRRPSTGRIPPVGAASAPVKAGGPAGAARWVACLDLDGRDSDEDSYVTACNTTPLLSRAAPGDRAAQQPDNRRSTHTGTGNGRRRRRRLKMPSAPYEPLGVDPPTLEDHPERQATGSTIVFVPIPVIIFLLLLYVAGGVVTFRKLYGVDDWASAAFISVAAMLTVGGWYPDRGTGDAAAGRWVSWPPDARFIYALWVVVGLAVVSACLRLTVQTFSYCTPSCRQTVTRSQP